MATIEFAQLQNACQRVSTSVMTITDSVDRLQNCIRQRIEESPRPGLLSEAYELTYRLAQALASVSSGLNQLESAAGDPYVFPEALRSYLDRLLEGIREATELYRPVYDMIRGEDTAQASDLNQAADHTMKLFDKLGHAARELGKAVAAAAAQAELRQDCAAPSFGPSFEPSHDIYCDMDADCGFGHAEPESSAPDSPWIPACPTVCPPSPVGGSSPEPPSMPAPAPAPAPSARKVKPVRVDSVAFSVLSPERVKAGEYSSVDVYMYTKSQRKIIEKAIKAAKDAVKETGKGGFSVSRGTEVSVILTSDDVRITDEVDTRTWDGECCKFDFQFLVPEDYARKQIAFTCQVLFGGIQITRLHFTVSLSAGGARVPVRVKRRDCRKAFVSYSHKDEKRVLSQLSAIAEVAPRMVFWLDSQSLESGDIWRNEIRRAIRNADVFLLFWSIYAMDSAEVEKEWRYAKKKKGLRFILPVPLDPPAQCPPPEELGKHLHFGHRSLSHTTEMDGLTFASSKQFRRIK